MDAAVTAPTAWWVCPNEPRCPHGAVVHDVYDDEDQVPRCCAEGCQCGARAKDGPLTEAEYAAMLPYRAAKIADEMNERLSGVLPDGMRFEWTEDPQ